MALREPDPPVVELKRAVQKLMSAHMNLVYASRGLPDGMTKEDLRYYTDLVRLLKGKVAEKYEELGGVWG